MPSCFGLENKAPCGIDVTQRNGCYRLRCFFPFRYMNRPVMSGPGLYDPTSIMNADTLNKCQREGWIKLAFYLLSFFYYLYG